MMHPEEHPVALKKKAFFESFPEQDPANASEAWVLRMQPPAEPEADELMHFDQQVDQYKSPSVAKGVKVEELLDVLINNDPAELSQGSEPEVGVKEYPGPKKLKAKTLKIRNVYR
jgi:hypothetical protein